VGADGLLLIEDDEEVDFSWRFFNSDGSEAEMCGNAARCVARLAYLDGIAGQDLTFRTIAGPIHASVNGAMVRVDLTRPLHLDPSFNLELEKDGRITAGFVFTGVPHTVIHLKDRELEELDVARLGREIRFHPRFSPAGTNVNFIRVLDRQTIEIRTYERGVEAETLACGTGAAAAALLSTVWDLTSAPVSVVTRSSDRLVIHLDPADPGHGGILMEGIASLVYRGQLTEETIQGG
jgi:diaminopimelate epimerase